MKRLMHFLTYNNAVPVLLGILFLSSGLVFAANDEVRGFVADSVYQAEQKVVSVDNSYIANKDLNSYSPKVSIDGVTEDDEFYYVSYTLTTIALDDYVWQDVAQQRVMQVTKTALGEYTDLGVYVTEQLKQIVDNQVAYLREVQGIEQRQVTNKVVATAYGGLIGQFIDDSTEALPGYIPLVSEPEGEDVDPVAIAKSKKDDVVVTSVASNNSNGATTPNVPSGQSSSGPVINILGANPARVPLRASYSDLGVVVTSQGGATLNLTVHLSLNGEDVSQIHIDTAAVADWSIGYTVTDQNGKTSFAERVVVVYDPNASGTEETAATSTPESTQEEDSDQVSTSTSATTTQTTPDDDVVDTPAATTTVAETETQTQPPTDDSATEETAPVATSTDSGTADTSQETETTTATSTDSAE